jgi:hypothetical protein
MTRGIGVELIEEHVQCLFAFGPGEAPRCRHCECIFGLVCGVAAVAAGVGLSFQQRRRVFHGRRGRLQGRMLVHGRSVFVGGGRTIATPHVSFGVCAWWLPVVLDNGGYGNRVGGAYVFGNMSVGRMCEQFMGVSMFTLT